MGWESFERVTDVETDITSYYCHTFRLNKNYGFHTYQNLCKKTWQLWYLIKGILQTRGRGIKEKQGGVRGGGEEEDEEVVEVEEEEVGIL